jgi:hypothetical protein
MRKLGVATEGVACAPISTTTQLQPAADSPAGLLAADKEEQAVPRETKLGVKAGGLVTAAAATSVAELQQHRACGQAAAGVAEHKTTPDDAVPVKPVPAAADATPAGGVRNAFCGVGAAAAAEALDQDDAADTFAAGAVLRPPAKGLSPPRRPGARGNKSARASRPSDEDVRNSDEKPARHVASNRNLPRVAATNHTTAIDMLRAGRDDTAAATAAQRRDAPGGSSYGVSSIVNHNTAGAAACNNAPLPPLLMCTHLA